MSCATVGDLIRPGGVAEVVAEQLGLGQQRLAEHVARGEAVHGVGDRDQRERRGPVGDRGEVGRLLGVGAEQDGVAGLEQGVDVVVAGHDVEGVLGDDPGRHLEDEAADLLADGDVVGLHRVEDPLAGGRVGDELAAGQGRAERAALGGVLALGGEEERVLAEHVDVALGPRGLVELADLGRRGDRVADDAPADAGHHLGHGRVAVDDSRDARGTSGPRSSCRSEWQRLNSCRASLSLERSNLERKSRVSDFVQRIQRMGQAVGLGDPAHCHARTVAISTVAQGALGHGGPFGGSGRPGWRREWAAVTPYDPAGPFHLFGARCARQAHLLVWRNGCHARSPGERRDARATRDHAASHGPRRRQRQPRPDQPAPRAAPGDVPPAPRRDPPGPGAARRPGQGAGHPPGAAARDERLAGHGVRRGARGARRLHQLQQQHPPPPRLARADRRPGRRRPRDDRPARPHQAALDADPRVHPASSVPPRPAHRPGRQPDPRRDGRRRPRRRPGHRLRLPHPVPGDQRAARARARSTSRSSTSSARPASTSARAGRARSAPRPPPASTSSPRSPVSAPTPAPASSARCCATTATSSTTWSSAASPTASCSAATRPAPACS